MSAWASAAPVIGTGSLDGFAAGALMSVVCAMAITTPRRARRPPSARGGAQAAERNGWLSEHVVTAEAVGLALAAEAAVAEAAPAVMIETAGTGLAAAEVAGPEATIDAAETAGTGIDWTGLAGAGLADESFGAGAERLARQEEVGVVFADGVFPRIGFAGGRSRRDAHPDIEFSDAELALVPLACPGRPEARRLPRHAAPSIGLGTRMAKIGSRMTGLFATRALASGARG